MNDKTLGADAAAVVTAGQEARNTASHVAHTPGPWVYRDDDIQTLDGKVHVVCFGHDYDDYGGIGSSKPVASGDALAHNAEVEANAHLIAAAPDLLDALKRIVAGADVGTIVALDDPMRAAAKSMIDQGRAAIAKAEGR